MGFWVFGFGGLVLGALPGVLKFLCVHVFMYGHLIDNQPITIRRILIKHSSVDTLVLPDQA